MNGTWKILKDLKIDLNENINSCRKPFKEYGGPYTAINQKIEYLNKEI